MRMAFLCKRHYMGKDVIADRYARLYEIPYQLVKLGHTHSADKSRERGRWTIIHDHDFSLGIRLPEPGQEISQGCGFVLGRQDNTEHGPLG
jgi:hypothetical protein